MKGKDPDDAVRDTVRIHLYVSGVVQGVFFRTHTTNTARSLSLIGWVKNLTDGRVEIVAEGARGKITEFISWCKKGLPAASVERVEVIWERPIGDMEGFQTRY
ncbi:MAG: acylphosphatase [bacterium]